jgi:hypothetical protein
VHTEVTRRACSASAGSTAAVSSSIETAPGPPTTIKVSTAGLLSANARSDRSTPISTPLEERTRRPSGDTTTLVYARHPRTALAALNTSAGPAKSSNWWLSYTSRTNSFDSCMHRLSSTARLAAMTGI